jgi:CelD/BcsL family acetyltransferase involved in cellulose biosynthesis
VRISVIRPSELGPAEIDAWHSMQRASPTLSNPFLCPEFAVAVGKFRSDARVAVLSDGPDTIGFFPFERRKLGVGMPIGAGLSDFQGLAHAAGAEWDPRELLRACRISVWQFDHLVAGQKPFERFQVDTAASPYIDLREGFDTYRTKLQARSPKFYKTVSYKSRKLGREAGELRYVLDSRDDASLRTLMTWKSDQYRRTGRIDRFSQPWVVDLVGHLLQVRGNGFAGLLSFLYAGDTPVAGHFGLRFDCTLTGWFPAYDTRFSRYSPGLIQHLWMAEELAAAGVHQIEMGKGAKDYKESLKSGDLFVAEGIVTGRSVAAAAHWARSSPARWAVRQVREHQPLFHAADRTLRHFGRVRSRLRPVTPVAGVTREGFDAEG